VLKEAGREHPHLPESIEGHRERFGRAPELLAGDRGLYSKEGEEVAKRAGIRRMALPQSGRLTKKRKEYEEQPCFSSGPSRSGPVWRDALVSCAGGTVSRAASNTEKKAWAGGSGGESWYTTSPRLRERNLLERFVNPEVPPEDAPALTGVHCPRLRTFRTAN
jgi:hypothetical protein